MSADYSTWPMIDAASLFSQRGCEVVSDIDLPDGTLPLSSGHRMDRAEWNRYRALCAAAGLREIQERQHIEMEGCAS